MHTAENAVSASIESKGEMMMYWVICPYCGYKMPARYEEGATCQGVYLKCKGRHCRRAFEIHLPSGNSGNAPIQN